MKAIADFFRVPIKPRAVFESLDKSKHWVAAALIFLLSVAVMAGLSAPAQTKIALVDMQKHAADMPPGALESAKEYMNSPAVAIFAALTAGVVLIIGTAVKAGLFNLGASMFGGRGNFMGALSVTAYGSAPLAWRNFAGGLVSSLTGQPIAKGLSALLPAAARTGPLGTLMGGLDIFTVWSVVITTIGLIVLFKLERKKALVLSVGIWVLPVILSMGAVAVGRSFTGV